MEDAVELESIFEAAVELESMFEVVVELVSSFDTKGILWPSVEQVPSDKMQW